MQSHRRVVDVRVQLSHEASSSSVSSSSISPAALRVGSVVDVLHGDDARIGADDETREVAAGSAAMSLTLTVPRGDAGNACTIGSVPLVESGVGALLESAIGGDGKHEVVAPVDVSRLRASIRSVRRRAEETELLVRFTVAAAEDAARRVESRRDTGDVGASGGSWGVEDDDDADNKFLLSREQLRRIAACPVLRRKLADSRLQTKLRDIDGAGTSDGTTDREAMLVEAMEKDPAFYEFAGQVVDAIMR